MTLAFANRAQLAAPLLKLLAGELARCRMMVGRIEAELLPLIDQGTFTGAGLQDIDLLDQNLDDLAAFLRTVSESLPTGVTVDAGPALELLGLDDLRGRLAGNAKSPGPVSRQVALFLSDGREDLGPIQSRVTDRFVDRPDKVALKAIAAMPDSLWGGDTEDWRPADQPKLFER